MYSPYLYAGEQKAKHNYFNLRYFQNNNRERLGSADPSTGGEGGTDRGRMILGIESSFDDSCAGIVSSAGKVLANAKRTIQKDKFDMRDAPLRAMHHHRENLPIAVEQALEAAGGGSIAEMEAIAVTIGPGQKGSLNEGIKLA